MAVICVKSGSVLWSAAHDIYLPTPWGALVTLNYATIAYTTEWQLSVRPALDVRDILTGEIKATKPLPDSLLLWPPLAEDVSFQLHPRRDLVFLAARTNVFFFSATTANCVGRLSLAVVSSIGSSLFPQDNPLRFCFSEHQPKFSPSAREKFFLYQYNRRFGYQTYYCFEYEIPTDEDISTSEARIPKNGNQGSDENLISKILRIQIYEHEYEDWRSLQFREWLLQLNPMLKQIAHTEFSPSYRASYTQVRSHFFERHYPLPEDLYDISLEPGKPHDGSIPIEFYPQGNSNVLVTKPKQAPGRLRRHTERADCLLPKVFYAPITLTERYMFLKHQTNVYLFAYEPGW